VRSVAVEMTNCYGIRQLSHIFDGAEGRAFLVYAPNGSMKTSFARALADLSQGEQPKDAIFPHRETVCAVKNGDGKEWDAAHILVVEPYDAAFSSEKTSALMADKKMRVEYERLTSEINDRVESLLKRLGQSVGIRNQVGTALANAFDRSPNDVAVLLEELDRTLDEEEDPNLRFVPYATIFNSKVESFLATPSVKKELAEYVDRYNELLASSTYFRSGGFNHTGADSVRKSLGDSGFFDAQHKITLVGSDSTSHEIETAADFEQTILAEKQQILKDPDLLKRFEAIDQKIAKNAELRLFRDCLEGHPEILPELADMKLFRKRVLYSHLHGIRSDLADFGTEYRDARVAISVVVQQAKGHETEWRDVVTTFGRRFTLPFTVAVANQEDVILKDQAPSFVFNYQDGDDRCELAGNALEKVLSTGEKRALYLLNVMYEIKAREKLSSETLLVLDDVADSFDYKNKYAIVEYLKSIVDGDKFDIIILTHNFDFFRTVQGRLGVKRKNNCLMVSKSGDGVKLLPAAYVNNPFGEWRRNLHTNRRMLVAAIPMARNLVEYSVGKDSPDYILLTSLLHQKSDTVSISMSEVVEVLKKVMHLEQAPVFDSEKAIDIIFGEADACDGSSEAMNLEDKVVLSIGIRMLAEAIMIRRIDDPERTSPMSSNQTRELFDMFKSEFPHDMETAQTLEQVMLMTPESIHLNSFMYEPILDMADCQLRTLYAEMKDLSAS